jgi:mono/diheme cytochrome c family protein
MEKQPAAPDARMIRDGERLYHEVCSACHTLDPPPNLAPPLRMVSRHLRRAFDTREEAVDHVVSYAPAPDPERSILPSHAIDRFGLMPPQPLRPDQLEKVATYVWSLTS